MIGTTLGSYRIVSEIGSGGMGVVYLAEHTLIGRKAAVKLLRSDMPQEYVDRFFNEAKAAATLHHPGLVDVFDFGQNKDGSAFIVMEFLQGESLAQRLEREPRLPIAFGLAITRSVAMSLAVAHAQGIVHRDLKPANIFLLEDADAPMGVRTKVLDFGIAKLQRDRDVRSVKTQSGAVIGTPRYMSPEQCKNARDVDGRADIYSLGCILYEVLLGVAPYDYDSWAELVGAHIYETPPKPRDIDPKLAEDVETLLLKMLEKTPANRFQSMNDLAQSLEVLIVAHGGVVRSTPATGLRPVTPAQGVRKFDSGRDLTLPASASSPSLPAVKEPEAPVKEQKDITTVPVKIERKPPWLAIGLAGAGVVAIAMTAIIVLGKDDKPETEPAFVVVDKRGSAEEPSVPDAAPDAAVAQIEEPPPIDAGVRTPIKPPTETDVAALTRTFGKQSPAITACFRAHPKPSEQVSVRIQIDKAGTVRAAEVLPASIGQNTLGSCILAIAKQTTFGPQPKPATFRVPLHTN